MTAARKTARRRAAKPASELSVYSGSVMLGEIKPSPRGFVARMASGRRLPGAFANEREAMRAITSSSREERAALPISEQK